MQLFLFIKNNVVLLQYIHSQFNYLIMKKTDAEKIEFLRCNDGTGVLRYCTAAECMEIYPRFIRGYRRQQKSNYIDGIIDNLDFAVRRLHCRYISKYGRKIAAEKYHRLNEYRLKKVLKF